MSKPSNGKSKQHSNASVTSAPAQKSAGQTSRKYKAKPHRLRALATELELQRVRALQELETAIAASLNLQAVLHIAVKKIKGLFPGSSGFIRLLNSESGLLEPVNSWNVALKDWKEIFATKGRLSTAAFNSPAHLFVRDLRKDLLNRYPEFAAKHRMVSYLGIPLVSIEKRLGVLSLHYRKVHQFKTDEIEFLSMLAGKVALAVRNAQLLESVTQQAKKLKAANDELTTRTRQQALLTHIAHLALARSDLRALLNETVDLVALTLQVDYCKLLELLSDGESLLLRAGFGWKKGYVGSATVRAGTGSQAGYTLLRSEPIIVEDYRKERRFAVPALLNNHEVVSGMSVVIQGRERPFGVLGVDTNKKRAFGENDVQFLQGIANVLATAIERARLEQSKFQLAAIVESSHDAIVGRTPDGLITSWNRGAETIYGYSAEEAIGQPISMLIAADQLHRVKANRVKILKGERIDHYETVALKKGGDPVLVSLAISPIKDAGGRIVGASNISRDITERKRAEEKLRSALQRAETLSRRVLGAQETERRHLARELHDEIGQALTAIKLNLQKVLRYPDPGTLNQWLADSILIVDRLLQQVRQLSLDLRPQILDDLGLKAALRWYGNQQAKRAGLRFELRADEEVRLNPTHQIVCFRVAQEALTNIVRHARARTATVELRLQDDRLHLVVRDDGAGFDQAAVPQGGGLGLLGMTERVLLAGGDLELKSEPGKGTEVHAIFPLATPASPGVY
ncbi:MAG: PAS domain S-box protein [Deltaproteobacteria bacterium]|nr:PAS domain S-box protein [Deltaproteobacteria bacterium]